MTCGVVTIGRASYAVGLYWENSPGGGRVAQIAKEAARQNGQQAAFFTVRPGNKNGRIAQFGLTVGETRGELKPGMPVLAACLANQIPGSWVGAFNLNAGVALIVVRDDLIVPDGDLFFTNESDARDRLLQEIGFGGLQATYAPESWSIPGADTVPLTLLLNDQKDIKLQAVQISERAKLVAVVSAAAFILALGIAWYWQERADTEREQLAVQQEALRQAQMARSLLPGLHDDQMPEVKYERVWESAAQPVDIIENCKKGLVQVPAAWGGWRLTQVRCDGGSLNTSWTRESGASLPPMGGSVNDLVNSASKVVPLDKLTPRGAEALVDPEQVTRRYLAQDWPGSLVRLPDDPPPPPPPDYKGQWNPPPPPWVKRSFTLSVPELPSVIPDLLGGLPGVVINMATYTSNGVKGNWTIEGIIYENRK